MRLFSVVGVSGSGKTTTIEGIIRELRKRGYTVGSTKSVNCGPNCHLRSNGKCHCHSGNHKEFFTIDTEGSNSHRHREAGSQLVSTRSGTETAVMFQNDLPLEQLLRYYNHDFVILEGDYTADVPRIVTAKTEKEVQERKTDKTFAVSGRIAAQYTQCCGLPAVNGTTAPEALVDLIIKMTKDKPSHTGSDCSSSCSTCRTGCTQSGESFDQADCTTGACGQSQNLAELEIGGVAVPMAPFVQKILRNAVLGIVSELEGYCESSEITVKIGSGHGK